MDTDPRDAIRDARSRRCETCGWTVYDGKICGTCYHRSMVLADRQHSLYDEEESASSADLNDPGIKEM